MDAAPDRASPPGAADAAGLAARLREHLQARLIETHVSWVLLAGDDAWKIKKPVRLPFLDFGTLGRRRHFCEEELRLNRRLAPSLYLDVVAVGGTADAPVLGGDGPAIEYALHMRRFPDGALLSERLAAHELGAGLVDRLAERLVRFHRDAAVAAPDSPYGTVERITADTNAVIDGLAAHAAAVDIEALRAWSTQQAERLRPVWTERRRTGCVREGHGDLHLANTVVLGDDVTAFDCIEFDPALRWIDVQADIAFLVMDLLAHDRTDLAFRFLDAYLAGGGDHGGLAVLRYFVVYRALVRALVALLRPPEGPALAASSYLALVQRELRPAPPRLLITHGVSGSGKSTLAQRLLERCAAVRLRSDVERKRLHGLGALESSRSPADGGLYAREASADTYERLCTLARHALQAGWPTIVDATFLRADDRRAFAALAHELGVPFSILHCEAPPAVLHERLRRRGERRGDPSEADAQVLARQLRMQEPLAADEWRAALVAGASTAADDIDRLAAAWLHAA